MGLLTEADGEVRAWLERTTGSGPVDAGPPGSPGPPGEPRPPGEPGSDAGGAGLTAYLMALDPVAEVARDRHHPAPAVVRLRYLLAGRGDDHRAGLDLLDRVLAATLDDPPPAELDVDVAPAAPELWPAFGAHPRPALTLSVTVRRVREPADAVLVRQPLRVVEAGVRGLRGRVVGPDDVPLAGVEVVVAATRATTRTSTTGAFSLAAVPAGPDPIRLAVRAKGRVFTVDIEPDGDEPVVIHCDLLEA
jgi:hypothetical protein